jgi:hypothetical protein
MTVRTLVRTKKTGVYILTFCNRFEQKSYKFVLPIIMMNYV